MQLCRWPGGAWNSARPGDRGLPKHRLAAPQSGYRAAFLYNGPEPPRPSTAARSRGHCTSAPSPTGQPEGAGQTHVGVQEVDDVRAHLPSQADASAAQVVAPEGGRGAVCCRHGLGSCHGHQADGAAPAQPGEDNPLLSWCIPAGSSAHTSAGLALPLFCAWGLAQHCKFPPLGSTATDYFPNAPTLRYSKRLAQNGLTQQQQAPSPSSDPFLPPDHAVRLAAC